MGYVKKTLRRMRPKQKRAAEIQLELESAVRKLKKLVNEIGDIESDAAFNSAPLRSPGIAIERGRQVKIEPCPDAHFCWKCGQKWVATLQEKSDDIVVDAIAMADLKTLNRW